MVRNLLICCGIFSYILSICFFIKRCSAIRCKRALFYSLIHPPAILIAGYLTFKISETRLEYGDFLFPLSLTSTGCIYLLYSWLYLYDGAFFLLLPYAHLLDIIKGAPRQKCEELVSKWTLPPNPEEGYLVRIVQYCTVVFPLFVIGVFFLYYFTEVINNLFLK